MVDNSEKVIPILKKLVDRGWIPLRSMAVLLDYNHVVQVYQRQKTNNRILTVKVGGTQRVYEAEVVRVLENPSDQKRASAEVALNLYRRLKNE